MSISLVIPAYNEQDRLPPFLSSIAAYHKQHQLDIREVLIIDDGSTDQTVVMARQFTKDLPLQIIQHEHNQGKGAAVQTGVMQAQGDTIVFMDADGATAIDELPKMVTALQTADIAVGNRWMKGAQTQRHSFIRRLAGWVYRTYLRFFGLGAIDTMCGFKGYRRTVAVDLFSTLIEKRWLFDTEIAYKAVKAGYRITNFPIRWESKDGSKLDTKTLLKSAWSIWPLIQHINKQ